MKEGQTECKMMIGKHLDRPTVMKISRTASNWS